MAAYIIFIRERVSNADLMVDYADKARAARGDHPIRALAAYGEIVALEGDEAEGVLIAEFPDMAHAKAWYFSPAYQEAMAIRKQAADYRVLLVGGL